MSRTDERGEKVFVSMNSDGQVVITPAEEFRKSLTSLGIDGGQLPAPPQGTAELDSVGRLKLPAEILAYFR